MNNLIKMPLKLHFDFNKGIKSHCFIKDSLGQVVCGYKSNEDFIPSCRDMKMIVDSLNAMVDFVRLANMLTKSESVEARIKEFAASIVQKLEEKEREEW